MTELRPRFFYVGSGLHVQGLKIAKFGPKGKIGFRQILKAREIAMTSPRPLAEGRSTLCLRRTEMDSTCRRLIAMTRPRTRGRNARPFADGKCKSTRLARGKGSVILRPEASDSGKHESEASGRRTLDHLPPANGNGLDLPEANRNDASEGARTRGRNARPFADDKWKSTRLAGGKGSVILRPEASDSGKFRGAVR